MLLKELLIGQLKDKIEVVLDVDKTKHATKRQTRHKNVEITEKDMLNTAEKAIDNITDALVFNRIDIGDYVHVRDISNNLNLVGVIQRSGNKLQLKIVTVMVKQNFIPKQGTYSMKVR